MIILIVFIVVILIIGLLLSYDGNPIRGLMGIHCSISKRHKKEFDKTDRCSMYVCKRCGGTYYEGNFTIL